MSKSVTSLEQWCDSGGVFAHSHVSPQVKPLPSPCGPALPPGADLLVMMMGGVSRGLCCCEDAPLCHEGSPTLELPSFLSPSSSSSSNQLLSFLHPQTSPLCFMHLAAFLGRLHMLQSAGSQLGSGCGSFAFVIQKTPELDLEKAKVLL